MNDREETNRLDKAITGAIGQAPKADFAAWRGGHHNAVAALETQAAPARLRSRRLWAPGAFAATAAAAAVTLLVMWPTERPADLPAAPAQGRVAVVSIEAPDLPPMPFSLHLPESDALPAAPVALAAITARVPPLPESTWTASLRLEAPTVSLPRLD